MLSIIFSALAAFITTNLDDLLVLTILFSDTRNKRSVIVGQYLGIGALIVTAIIISGGIKIFAPEAIKWLGTVPLFLGIKACFEKNGGESRQAGWSVTAVAGVTIAAGGDNIGVYVPLFCVQTTTETVLTAAVFFIMTALWCFAAYRLSDTEIIKRRIEKYKRFLIPTVFIALGVWLLFH